MLRRLLFSMTLSLRRHPGVRDERMKDLIFPWCHPGVRDERTKGLGQVVSSRVILEATQSG
jgi:hypothetical protein